MKARYMVEHPDDIEMTAKITMKMSQWEQLRDQLKDAHPSWRLSQVINDMLSDARKVFHARDDDPT